MEAINRRRFIGGTLIGMTGAGLTDRWAAAQTHASGASSMRKVQPSSFLDALRADGPAPDRADKMQLYGRFIGRWEMDVVAPGEGGATHTGKGEIHFGWALEGRAVQDVWITPPRGWTLCPRGGQRPPRPPPPPRRHTPRPPLPLP